MNETVFGKYRLLELLGQGGMGQVFRAFDTVTERIVALKVLSPDMAKDDVFKERFRREAHAAAGLTEPHVIPIHGFGEIDGRLYVDMRLIDGRDLESMLAAGPLPPDRGVMIIEQVAAALAAAHRAGLVHRDVKPSNIVVAANDFAYLIDFGIARAMDESGLTGTGMAIGTFAYMAPERFETGRPDHRSDIYSLACVLHECLTGQQPFVEKGTEQQIAAHLTRPPPLPSAILPQVPREFDAVVEKGMAKNPDERYQTATDLARAARSALAGHSTTLPYGMPSVTQLNSGMPSGVPASFSPRPPGPTPDWAHETLLRPTSVPPTALTGAPPPSRQMPSLARRRKWVFAGIAAAAVLAVVATIAMVLVVLQESGDSGRKTPPSAPSAAPPTTPPTTAPTPAGPDIDTLLLNGGEISSTTGIAGMQLDGSRQTWPYVVAPVATAPPECEALAYSGSFDEAELNGTGWIAMRGEIYRGPDSHGRPTAQEAVVELPTAQLTINLRDRIAAAWHPCNGKTYTAEGYSWESRVMSKSDRTIAVAVEQADPDWSCQTVITSAQNYVVLAETCKLGAPAAEAIADRIIARVNGR
ncbi:serine/threonine-protein kinase PknH/PknJ [Mycobacterium sp. E2733]|uniref:serine/threonine-protein kinase PknH/PknJ n=1 Tax=Mycobacterium sp. E2733 TaxID=1834138 RepID=UPI0007FCED9D|nr:serine/threonine-protein kinase PknH/PknJ [Mycobacterium sp. E2733]OBH94905.1 hypothetical protein A5678_04165 [Mycobacterium sp. E2733]